MEHIIDSNISAANESSSITLKNNTSKSNTNQIISREERENILYNNYKKALNKTIENLNINKSSNEMSKENNNDGLSIIDDDNISMASSKILSSGNKSYKNSKLPSYIGSQDFYNLPYLGLIDKNLPSSNNLTSPNSNNNGNINNNPILMENNLSNNENFEATRQNNRNNLNNNIYNYNSSQNSNQYNNFSNPENIKQYNNRNLDHNYDYNTNRPSMVSEFARPDFKQIMEHEISLGLNKKISMEFNLQNNINNDLIKNDLYPQNQNDFRMINNPPNSYMQNIGDNSLKFKSPINVKSIKIKGKVPKAPPLPSYILQNIKKIPPLKAPNQNSLNNGLLMGINQKIFQKLNKDDTHQHNSFSNKDSNINFENSSDNLPRNYDKNIEENPKPLSFKEKLSLRIGGIGGKPIIQSIPIRNTMPNFIENENEASNLPNNNIFNQNKQNLNHNPTIENLNQSSLIREELKYDLRKSVSDVNEFSNRNQIPSNTNSSEKHKNITLNNFVKKSNLFDIEEDDEEDNTGLFKRATSNNLNLTLNKRNTLNNLNFNDSFNNIDNPSIIREDINTKNIVMKNQQNSEINASNSSRDKNIKENNNNEKIKGELIEENLFNEKKNSNNLKDLNLNQKITSKMNGLESKMILIYVQFFL